MYDEKSLEAFRFAFSEAMASGATVVKVDDLLLGIVRADPPLALRFFRTTDPYESLLAGMGRKAFAETVPLRDLPVTDRFKAVLERAKEECSALGGEKIGLEHLLLAIAGVDNEILEWRGLRYESLRGEIERSMRPPGANGLIKPPGYGRRPGS